MLYKVSKSILVCSFVNHKNFKLHKVTYISSDLSLKRTYLSLKRIVFTYLSITCFFCKQRFFSTQPQWCLTFSCNEIQMLLRCCLIHIPIIIMKHILNLNIFVCVSRPNSIYVVSFLSIFLFQSHFHWHCLIFIWRY